MAIADAAQTKQDVSLSGSRKQDSYRENTYPSSLATAGKDAVLGVLWAELTGENTGMQRSEHSRAWLNRSPWRTNPWLQPCGCRATREESPANIAFILSLLYTLNLNSLLREDTRDILESDVGLYRRPAQHHPRSRVTLLILNTWPAHAR